MTSQHDRKIEYLKLRIKVGFD